MKYLITGNKGFIGTALTKALPGSSGFDIKQSAFQDVSNIYNLSDAVNDTKPDVIVNLAAISGIRDCIDNPRSSFNVNVTGALNVLTVAKAYDINRVVFASSGAVDVCPTPYHAHKRFVENIAEAYRKTHGVSSCCLRFSNVYGIGSINKTSVIASMFKTAITSGYISVEGDGRQSRDFIHIDDVVSAIKIASESDYNGFLPIASGIQYPIITIARMIAEVTGAEIQYALPRPNDVFSNIVRIDKSIINLEWKPKNILIEDQIESLYEYFKNEILLSGAEK